MKVSFLVDCEYWEADSSRYRLALTNELLIPSLRTQGLDDIYFWLRQTPMDPRWSARREAFAFLGRPVKHRGEHPPWRIAQKFRPVIEVQTPDDIGFVPGFLQALRKMAGTATRNTTLYFRHGQIWDDGQCREAFGRGVRVRILVEDKPDNGLVQEVSKPAWCVAKHQMNDPWVDQLRIGGQVACCLPSINASTLGRYCRMQILTGTAAGATRLYHRGRSMILSASHKGRRSP